MRVFDNSVMRRLFGPKREELAGVWRKLRNEELHGLYFPPTIVRVIKSRRMRWGGTCSPDGSRERRVQSFGGET
jgi:hypothetical protein